MNPQKRQKDTKKSIFCGASKQSMTGICAFLQQTKMKQNKLYQNFNSATTWIGCQLFLKGNKYRGGGIVISILAFYSKNPSSNPSEFFCTILRKDKNNEKWPGLIHFFKKMRHQNL